MLAQHRGERSLVEQVDLDELDAVAIAARFSYARRVAHDADDLVAALEQQLGEIRAVLAADARDDARGALSAALARTSTRR